MTVQTILIFLSNRWIYIAAATAVLVFAIIGAVSVSSQDEQSDRLSERLKLLKKPDQTLSVDETLGVVFNPWLGGPSRKYYARANPQAKDAIYKMLGNGEMKEFHAHAWAILGYIGEAPDVRHVTAEIEELKSIQRMLTPEERDLLTALFSCLGVMCGRDIVPACDAAEKMMKPSYWRDSGFRWPGNFGATRLNHENRSVMYLMIGYSLSLDPKLEKHVRSILKEVENAQQREMLEMAIKPNMLLGHGWNIRSEEEEPVSYEESRELASYFNGDLQNPGSARPPRQPFRLGETRSR